LDLWNWKKFFVNTKIWYSNRPFTSILVVAWNRYLNLVWKDKKSKSGMKRISPRWVLPCWPDHILHIPPGGGGGFKRHLGGLLHIIKTNCHKHLYQRS
jgi:hypothetical protein